MRALKPALLLCLAACSTPVVPGVDAGNVDSGVVDAGLIDSGTADSGTADSGPPDAGPFDAGAPYVATVFDDVRIGSDSTKPNFHRARAAFTLDGASFAKVTLVTDLRSTCTPFESWKANPPPAGQSWPADCDAFDRNYEFVVDPATDAGQPPGVELVRAITPFGGPLHLEVDLTDFANARPGAHVLEVTVPTYSDGAGKVTGSNGGWNVTARLDVVPGSAPRKVLGVVPLFNGSRGAGEGLNTTFTTPPGTAKTSLQLRATGHGGGAPNSASCIGPAEEFCKRTHHLLVDLTDTPWVPWRMDCQNNCTVAHYPSDGGSGGFDYCAENPCGNMNSVRAPRANWCPGTVTPPYVLEPAVWATPGAHSFDVLIDDVAQGGTWRLSAVVYFYGP